MVRERWYTKVKWAGEGHAANDRQSPCLQQIALNAMLAQSVETFIYRFSVMVH